MQVELTWPPDRTYGSWIGGICGFFKQFEPSTGAWLHATETSITFNLFNRNHENIGGIEMPAHLSNLVAMRDDLNRVIGLLERKAELAVLAITTECPGITAEEYEGTMLAAHWQNGIYDSNFVDGDTLNLARERLHQTGCIATKVEADKTGYVITEAGATRLAAAAPAKK